MFESQEKKSLQSKYNKMACIGAATGKKFKLNDIIQKPEDFTMPGTKAGKTGAAGTVYGELKLSAKLQDQLTVVKGIVD